MKSCWIVTIFFFSFKGLFAYNTDTLNVDSWGAIANDGINDEPAISKAISKIKPGGVVQFSKGIYDIGASILLRSNITIIGDKTILKQGKPKAPIFKGSQLSNLKISAIHFQGLGFDYINRGNYTAKKSVAIFIDGGLSTEISIVSCVFERFGYSAIHLGNTKTFIIAKNRISGPSKYLKASQNYSFGIYISFESAFGRIVNNKITGTAQGIYLTPNLGKIVIDSNEIDNIVGQHGVYAAGGSPLFITNNRVSNTYYCGIKVQLQKRATNTNIENLHIEGNTISESGSHGILIHNVSCGDCKYIIDNVYISNNTIFRGENSKDGGITVIKAYNVVIRDNNIQNGRTGIDIRDVKNLKIEENTIIDVTLVGISLTSSSHYPFFTNGSSRIENKNPVSKDIRQTENVDIFNNYISLKHSNGEPFLILRAKEVKRNHNIIE